MREYGFSMDFSMLKEDPDMTLQFCKNCGRGYSLYLEACPRCGTESPLHRKIPGKLWTPALGAAGNRERTQWILHTAMFDLDRLTQEERESFLKEMKMWHWEHDDELFWIRRVLASAQCRYQGERSIFVYSSYGFTDRLELLLKVLVQRYPRLEARFSGRYGGLRTNWMKGLQDFGGLFSVELKDGKVLSDDLPIT